MNIQLSDHFTYRRLIRFVIPSVAMMILTSIYGVVDGLFVSNFVWENRLCGSQSCDPFHIGFGRLRLYAGDRRHCPCGENLGRGQARGGQIGFFPC